MALKSSRRASPAPTSGASSRALFAVKANEVGNVLIARAQAGEPLLVTGFGWPYRARTGEPYSGVNAILLPEQAAALGCKGDAFVGRGDAYDMGYDKPSSTPVVVTGTYHGFVDLPKKEADGTKSDTETETVRVLRTFEVAHGGSLGMQSSPVQSTIPSGNRSVQVIADAIEARVEAEQKKRSPAFHALAFDLAARVLNPSLMGLWNKELVTASAPDLAKPEVWSAAAYVAADALEELGVNLKRPPVPHDTSEATKRESVREAYRQERRESKAAYKAAKSSGIEKPVVKTVERIVFTDW